MPNVKTEEVYVNIDPEYANYSNEVDRPIHVTEVVDHNLPPHYQNDIPTEAGGEFKLEPDAATGDAKSEPDSGDDKGGEGKTPTPPVKPVTPPASSK